MVKCSPWGEIQDKARVVPLAASHGIPLMEGLGEVLEDAAWQHMATWVLPNWPPWSTATRTLCS